MNNIVYINSDDNNTDKTNSSWCYSSTTINNLIIEVTESARHIHQTLKPGLPKCVYQLKLYNDLLKKGCQLQTEMSVLNFAVKQEAVRELIVVNSSLVIECIVETQINSHDHKRVRFDLENKGYSRGLLINFSDELQSNMIATINHSSVLH